MPDPRPNARAVGVLCEYLWENGARYNGTALYVTNRWFYAKPIQNHIRIAAGLHSLGSRLVCITGLRWQHRIMCHLHYELYVSSGVLAREHNTAMDKRKGFDKNHTIYWSCVGMRQSVTESSEYMPYFPCEKFNEVYTRFFFQFEPKNYGDSNIDHVAPVFCSRYASHPVHPKN